MNEMDKKATDYERHHMGDNKRFHVRTCNGGWQIYGVELEHVCDCVSGEDAERVAAMLECAADEIERLRQELGLARAYIFATPANEAKARQAYQDYLTKSDEGSDEER